MLGAARVGRVMGACTQPVDRYGESIGKRMFWTHETRGALAWPGHARSAQKMRCRYAKLIRLEEAMRPLPLCSPC